MMEIHLHIKFRFMGFDIGSLDKVIPLPEIPVSLPQRVLFNGNGVLLELLPIATSIPHGGTLIAPSINHEPLAPGELVPALPAPSKT